MMQQPWDNCTVSDLVYRGGVGIGYDVTTPPPHLMCNPDMAKYTKTDVTIDTREL